MEPNVDEVSLDINKIIQSLTESTGKLKPLYGDCSIYIVPPHLWELNKEMYTPRVVSIGPFHHGREELKVMEEHKRRYLCTFLDRINIGMREYIEGLKVHEILLHQSYVEIDGCTREEFIEMMAVDGAFLIEYLLKRYLKLIGSNDRVSHLRANVTDDLLLIENQLPFFYLKYLFGLVKKSDKNNHLSFAKILQGYLSYATPWNWPVTHVDIVIEESEIHHLLHLIIICLQHPGRIERKECKNLATPTVWELHQAGVKFKPSSSRNCLSNINFSNGILEIPMLQVTDGVENIFRNMQAFEHCHSDSKYYISDYIFIMDLLINNEDDVKVLVQSGIIENWLEDDRAVATVFNNLGKGNRINSYNFSYTHVIKDLNAYYKIKRHKWKASLKQKYFNNPWTIISVVAAAFLLLLTIIQTVCSILGVV